MSEPKHVISTILSIVLCIAFMCLSADSCFYSNKLEDILINKPKIYSTMYYKCLEKILVLHSLLIYNILLKDTALDK